jgi:hypothetical protein
MAIMGMEAIACRELDGADVIKMPETVKFLREHCGINLGFTSEWFAWFTMPRPDLADEDADEEDPAYGKTGLLITLPVVGRVILNGQSKDFLKDGYSVFHDEITQKFFKVIYYQYANEPIVAWHVWLCPEAKLWVRVEVRLTETELVGDDEAL